MKTEFYKFVLIHGYAHTGCALALYKRPINSLRSLQYKRKRAKLVDKVLLLILLNSVLVAPTGIEPVFHA